MDHQETPPSAEALSVGSDEVSPTDDDADGVWMTKAGLARVRRISIGSADRLIRRQRWRKQRGNDGRARVLVPKEWLEPRHADPSVPTDDPTDSPGGNPTDTTAISVLYAAISALTARAEAAERRADRAEDRADDERAKAEAADRRAVKAETDRDQLLASHNRALLEVEGLRQADRARRAAGRLARLKTAWRGE